MLGIQVYTIMYYFTAAILCAHDSLSHVSDSGVLMIGNVELL